MLNGRVVRAAATATGVTALPLLLLLGWYQARDPAEGVRDDLVFATILALASLLFLLFLVLAFIYQAAPAIRGAGAALRRFRRVVITLGIGGAMFVAFAGSIWAQGSGWPWSEPEIYLFPAAGVLGICVLFLPGALLQASMLDRMSG